MFETKALRRERVLRPCSPHTLFSLDAAWVRAAFVLLDKLLFFLRVVIIIIIYCRVIIYKFGGVFVRYIKFLRNMGIKRGVKGVHTAGRGGLRWDKNVICITWERKQRQKKKLRSSKLNKKLF